MKQIREVAIKDVVTYSVLPLPILALLWSVTAIFAIPHLTSIPLAAVLIAAIAFSYYLLKRFAIGLVLLYKIFSPQKIRNKCRFTPTCSTYMIMAINKYGLFVGVIKGVRRLFRCKPPNGGEDYP